MYLFAVSAATLLISAASPASGQTCLGTPMARGETQFGARMMFPEEGRMVGARAAQRLGIPMTLRASFDRIDGREMRTVNMADFEASLEGGLTDPGSHAVAVCPAGRVGYRWQSPQSLTLEIGIGVGGRLRLSEPLSLGVHVRPTYIQRHVGLLNSSSATAFGFDGGASLIVDRLLIGAVVERRFRTDSYWGVQSGYTF